MNQQAEQLNATPIDDSPVSEVSKLPRDLAVIKMENDTMMSAAAAHPRDYGKILADLKSQIDAFRSFAESAMYRKPLNRQGTKYATGLSVRAAEAIREAYGYNKVRTSIDRVDDQTLRVTAHFLDFQRCSSWECSALVSRRYKTRDGKTAFWSEDHWLGVVAPARASKLVREAILRCVPAGLKTDLEEYVCERLESLLDDKTISKLVESFASKGVTVEMIESYMKKQMDHLTRDDRVTLAGIWNAIVEDEANVGEIFVDDKKQPEQQQQSRTQAVADMAKKAEQPMPAGAAAKKAAKNAPKPVDSAEAFKR